MQAFLNVEMAREIRLGTQLPDWGDSWALCKISTISKIVSDIFAVCNTEVRGSEEMVFYQ